MSFFTKKYQQDILPGFRKTRVFKKAQPTGFWGFYWVLGYIGFSDFLFEQAVGKLVGWCSPSAKLLFRFTSTLDYLKICKFIRPTCCSLEAVDVKKSLIITGMTLWNWIKVGAAGFSTGFTPKTRWGLVGITRVSEPCILQVRCPSCSSNNSVSGVFNSRLNVSSSHTTLTEFHQACRYTAKKWLPLVNQKLGMCQISIWLYTSSSNLSGARGGKGDRGRFRRKLLHSQHWLSMT